MFNLVRATTKDNLTLSGLHLPGDKNKPVVLHLHGFEGDFFTNSFISTIAQKFKQKNMGLLTVQTRGMANEYLFKTTEGSWRKIGAHFEVMEDAYIDIDAWMEFLLAEGYTNIVIQGHSLGTMKTVRYLFEGSHTDKVIKIILLAPFDIMRLLENATNGKWDEYLEIAKQKVKQGLGEEIIPTEYLDVAMSFQTYVSHHQENQFEYMFNFGDKNYDFPLLQKINVPVKVIVGTADEYFHPANPDHPDEAISILSKKIKNASTTLIPDAGHGYDGFEENVADEVVDFLSTDEKT